MIPDIDELGIQVFLTSGAVRRFEQNEPGLAKQNLGRILPSTVFGEAMLMLAGDYHTTHFPTSAVACVELTCDPRPGWSFGSNISDCVVLSEEEFLEQVHHEEGDAAMRRDRPRTRGKEFVGFVEIELLGGLRLHAEVHGVTGPMAVQARTVDRWLESPALVLRRGVTGTLLVNPARVLRVSAYPGPPEAPPKALHAHFLPE